MPTPQHLRVFGTRKAFDEYLLNKWTCLPSYLSTLPLSRSLQKIILLLSPRILFTKGKFIIVSDGTGNILEGCIPNWYQGLTLRRGSRRLVRGGTKPILAVPEKARPCWKTVDERVGGRSYIQSPTSPRSQTPLCHCLGSDNRERVLEPDYNLEQVTCFLWFSFFICKMGMPITTPSSQRIKWLRIYKVLESINVTYYYFSFLPHKLSQ